MAGFDPGFRSGSDCRGRPVICAMVGIAWKSKAGRVVDPRQYAGLGIWDAGDISNNGLGLQNARFVAVSPLGCYWPFHCRGHCRSSPRQVFGTFIGSHPTIRVTPG